jgi:hypothetical protein
MLEQACGGQPGKGKYWRARHGAAGLVKLQHCLARRLEGDAAVPSGDCRPTRPEERRVHAYGARPASSVKWPCYLLAGAAFTEIASAST